MIEPGETFNQWNFPVRLDEYEGLNWPEDTEYCCPVCGAKDNSCMDIIFTEGFGTPNG